MYKTEKSVVPYILYFEPLNVPPFQQKQKKKNGGKAEKIRAAGWTLPLQSDNC